MTPSEKLVEITRLTSVYAEALKDLLLEACAGLPKEISESILIKAHNAVDSLEIEVNAVMGQKEAHDFYS